MTQPAAPLPRQPGLMTLAGPLFVELMLMIAVGLVGTALAARLSDATGAAFALGNQIAQMLFVLFRIVGAGVSVVVTQCLGGNRRDLADRVARASLGAASWIGLGCALIAEFGAAPLMRLLNAPPEVLPLAVAYLSVAAPALLLDVWLATLASVLRAHLYARYTLMVIVVMQLTQLALAWPLMRWLGLPGFALGMVAHRVLGLALLLWLWRLKLQLKPLLPDWWRLPREELAQVLHVGVPGAAENIAWRLSFVASLGAIGAMGAQALATHAYAYQLMMCILPFSLAVGLSGEILVGHLIGAGQLHAASQLVRRALARGMAVSTGLALLVGAAGDPLLRLFTNDEHIIATGRVLLWCSVGVESGRAFNLVLVNALRATGDARYPLTAGAGVMALVMGCGSWLLGLGLGLGLMGVWIAYAADEWIRGLLMWRRWVTLGWVPQARAAHRRLKLSRQAAESPSLSSSTP